MRLNHCVTYFSHFMKLNCVILNYVTKFRVNKHYINSKLLSFINSNLNYHDDEIYHIS